MTGMLMVAEQFLKGVFWISIAGFGWAFVGYPLVIFTGAAIKGERSARPGLDGGRGLPTVTVLLAVRNAANLIEARLENLLDQNYPSDLLTVVVVSNGSMDGTETVAREVAMPYGHRVRVLTSPAGDGKAGALNTAAAAAIGEIVVFADARQQFDADAVLRLVQGFRTAEIGAVSGRLLIGSSGSADRGGVARYWELETQLRFAEGVTGSVVGATGAIYAVRRDLLRPLPAGVILDDVYLPMQVVLQGYRVVLEPTAIAFDRPSQNLRAEYRRRVRTMVGNLELLRLMPELLVPSRNPIFFRYISHKLLRVLAPVFSLGLLVSSIALQGAAYDRIAGGLMVAYGLGVIGIVRPTRVLALPTAFLLLNAAGLSALLRPRRTAAELWA
jgi:poly-beta-1,6-N-acetyl-D-glucosamine synthase